MLKKLLLPILVLISLPAYADAQMAAYVLDGRFVIYGSSLQEVSQTVRLLFQKFQGAEGVKSLAVWQSMIRERMGVNLLDPVGAAIVGIDPQGSLAYVHLETNKGYMVFTVKNKELLAYTLDNLPNPVSYRILDGRYVVLSASDEILDYQNFQGITLLPEFRTIARVLNFNWTQNFVWIKGSYLREKSAVNPGQYIFPDGDRIGMVISISGSQASIDAYTVYKDKEVQNALKKSMAPLIEQRLSLLDFESGKPAVVGQAYFHIPSYIESIIQIDKAEELGLRRLFSDLEKADINLKDRLFPYLRGRVSYVVRAYDPLRKILDFSASVAVSDEARVKEFLSMAITSAQNKQIPILRKSLFTREFYGFAFSGKGFTLWAGLAEGHLVLSTSETELNILIKNIYEKNEGFLKTLPPAFARAVKGKVYGGQNIIFVNSFLQKIKPALLPAIPSLLLPFETVEWYYYLQEVEGQAGRRDTITGNFFKSKTP